MIFTDFCNEINQRLDVYFSRMKYDPNALTTHINKNEPRGTVTVEWSYSAGAVQISNAVLAYPTESKVVGYREHQLDLIQRIADDIVDFILYKTAEATNG